MARSSGVQHRPGGLNGFSAVRTAVLGLTRALCMAFPSVSAAPLMLLKEHSHDDEPNNEGTSLWVLYVASAVLVLLGGAFAGLTIALMGQDSIYLQVLAGDEADPNSKNARRVYNLLKRGKHWVLVTLLLSNVIVNESLPVVLDRTLGGGVAAVVGSTILIVIFGEVVPQSVCVRYGLPIGGYMSKPVLVLMWLMAPVAWPTAKLLDWALGEDHGTVYKKSGLKTLVTLHKSLGEVSERLNEDEVTIISAVLDLKEKAVEDVMTPMEDVFVMSEDTVLDEKTMDHILSQGYSRIPIHAPGNKENFVGMLLVKILITYDPEDGMRVRDFPLATLPETRPETSCLDIVNFFQEGKSHMVLVSEYPGEDHGALGVVTLEDVIEELIGEEIIDESDVYIDVHKAIRRLTPAPKARPQRRNTRDSNDFGATLEREEVLIDFEDGQNGQGGLERRGGSFSAQSDGPHGPADARQATFIMRRNSAGPDTLVSTAVPVKANLEEMRNHLKHLGPSNPATNPKNTKSTTVKIKGLAAAAAATTTAPSSRPAIKQASSAVAVPGEVVSKTTDGQDDEEDEATPLLRPKLITGKGGVQAVRRSYGGAGMSNAQERLAGHSPEVLGLASPDERDEGRAEDDEDKVGAIDFGTQTSPDVPGSEQQQQESAPAQEAPEQLTSEHRAELAAVDTPHGSHGSHDSLSELRTNGANTPRRRHLVRSGSITENIVEAGGVRKIVLQTASSEEDDGQHKPSSSHRHKGPAGSSTAVEDAEHDDDEPLSPDQGDGAGPSSQDAGAGEGSADAAGGQAGAGGQGGKKKNRRKKRKGPPRW